MLYVGVRCRSLASQVLVESSKWVEIIIREFGSVGSVVENLSAVGQQSVTCHREEGNNKFFSKRCYHLPGFMVLHVGVVFFSLSMQVPIVYLKLYDSHISSSADPSGGAF